MELESEARRDGKSVAQILDEISAEWIEERRQNRNGDEAEQERIRKRVMKVIGTIHGGDPTRATRSKELVRQIIRKKHEKERNASRRPH